MKLNRKNLRILGFKDDPNNADTYTKKMLINNSDNHKRDDKVELVVDVYLKGDGWAYNHVTVNTLVNGKLSGTDGTYEICILRNLTKVKPLLKLLSVLTHYEETPI